MTVTPLYAGLLGLLFLILSLRVIGRRRAAGVALGDGGDRMLLRRQRAQANFAEYVPLVLVLMTLAELRSVSSLVLHGIGVCLLAGRLLHAYGLSSEPERMAYRMVGMALTFSALGFSAAAVLLPSLLAIVIAP